MTAEEMQLKCAKVLCWCCRDEGRPTIHKGGKRWKHAAPSIYDTEVWCKASDLWDITVETS